MDVDSEYEGRRPHKGAARTAIHEIRTAIEPCRHSGQAVKDTAYPGGVCWKNRYLDALSTGFWHCHDIFIAAG